MHHAITHVALLVREYDEAIEFFTQRLGFVLIEDTYQPEQDKRWVVVGPAGSQGTSLLLARASKPEQEPFVGHQTGGRVFLFLATDDFWRDYHRLVEGGVTFVRPPAEMPYGTVAVFEDLYGNLWDLVQSTADSPAQGELAEHPSPLATWHELVRAKNPAGLEALLEEEVVLHSPIVHTPQQGKAITLKYLEAAFRVFLAGNFRYVRELAGPRDVVLEFLVELDGITVNGIDMIRWNDQGQIIDFKVMIRPLQAIKLVHQTMTAAL